MSTIHSRCYALYKLQKIDKIPTQEQMLSIGSIVVNKFREQTGGKQPKKIPAPEHVGKFSINYFPAFFTPEIDSSILHFLCGKKEKMKRKRQAVIKSEMNLK